MSERIKQLAQKAYADVIKNTPSFLVTKELYEQKFAELIVLKCAEIADTAEPFLASDLIKKHFGVEQ